MRNCRLGLNSVGQFNKAKRSEFFLSPFLLRLLKTGIPAKAQAFRGERRMSTYTYFMKLVCVKRSILSDMDLYSPRRRKEKEKEMEKSGGREILHLNIAGKRGERIKLTFTS